MPGLDWSDAILARLGSAAKRDEPLSEHTVYRIGGPATVYAAPDSLEDVRWLVQFCRSAGVSLFVIGGGANLLVSDRGYRGVVLSLRRCCGRIEIRGTEIRAGAGAELQALVETACGAGLAGLESLAGIPGTVGGAAVMNAGAFGTEFFDLAIDIDVLTPEGDVRTLPRERIDYGYRRGLDPQGGVIVSARVRLEPGDPQVLRQRAQEIRTRRAEKQPLEYPSCGSVFKRPEGDYAGRLIEACGLKGLRRGGAQVSEKHANFIVNLGGATAEDVLWLIREVRRRVYEQFGVLLEPEVRFVGFGVAAEELLAW